MDGVNRYEFHLAISPEEYLGHYRGTVRQVLVRCVTGQTLQFPSALLQRFVTPQGVRGHFVLTCDEHQKCMELQRVGNVP